MTRVLSPYDGMSLGIISALKSAGYGTPTNPLPDGHRPGRRAGLGEIHHRRRAVRRRSSRTPGNWRKAAVQMVDAVLTGRHPRSTTPRPTTTGSRSSPPTCSQPVIVDKWNYQTVLVDSGYYTAGTAARERSTLIGRRPLLEMRGYHQDDFPGVTALVRGQPRRCDRRRDPRDLRRERRREVDPDEGAVAGSTRTAATTGEIVFDGEAV